MTQFRCVATILYGLVVIWTGLMRSVEAQEFKPNAFWFCTATGLIAIAAGYLFRVKVRLPATILGLLAVVPVLSFYLYCFITQPEKDANYRVAIAIIASIAAFCVLTLPGPDCCKGGTKSEK